MWFDRLDINRHDLTFDLPYVNAAGTLGFYPDPKLSRLWGVLGAFITNPISFKPREVAHKRVSLSFQGGFLLHNGQPNPGFKKAVQKYANAWARASLPVIVHLMSEEPESLSEMIQILESHENVSGVELGFPPDMDPLEMMQLIHAAEGELPLIISLSPEESLSIAEELKNTAISMVRLAEPYGALPADDGSLVRGRIFGPATFPTALAEVQRLAGLGLRVIGGGGVYGRRQADAMRQAGAQVVALDALLWCGGTDLARSFGVVSENHSVG